MKILLATDGSSYSELAAAFLKCLNFSGDDEITVFHAVHWIPYLYDRESYFGALKSIKEAIAPGVIDSVVDLLKGIRARICTAIIDGDPEQCIIEAAAGSHCDLIVMGARGVRGIKSHFIGSVTNAVALHSSTPVFVTKPPGCHKKRLKILLAADGSPHSLATGNLLSMIPFPEDTEITIITVISHAMLYIPGIHFPGKQNEISELSDLLQKDADAYHGQVIEKTRECLGNRFQTVKVISRKGDPSTEILLASEQLSVDIVAAGCRGLRGLKGMMGSVSRNILTHSKCSVVIGKT